MASEGPWSTWGWSWALTLNLRAALSYHCLHYYITSENAAEPAQLLRVALAFTGDPTKEWWLLTWGGMPASQCGSSRRASPTLQPALVSLSQGSSLTASACKHPSLSQRLSWRVHLTTALCPLCCTGPCLFLICITGSDRAGTHICIHC